MQFRIAMAVVIVVAVTMHGARIQAKRLGVYEKIDDKHMQIVSDDMEG